MDSSRLFLPNTYIMISKENALNMFEIFPKASMHNTGSRLVQTLF